MARLCVLLLPESLLLDEAGETEVGERRCHNMEGGAAMLFAIRQERKYLGDLKEASWP